MQRYEHGGDIYRTNDVLLDFSINVNPLGFPEAARRAIVDNMDNYSAYPDKDCLALRAALADKHGVGADSILCGNGASDLIFRVCAMKKIRTALALAPTFSEYERTVRLFGGEMREHLLCGGNGFALTEGILPELSPDVDALFICNPNNPTGRLVEKKLLVSMLEKCRENGILMVLDECFLEFTDGESLVPLLAQYDNLLILRAFTKFYGMAGLRLGYVLGDPALIESIRPFGAEWSVSTVAQKAGLAALREPGWGERTRELVSSERAYLQTSLTELGLTVFQSSSNFLLVRGERPLCDALRERGILVRACDNFTGLDARYFRIGIKTHERNAALVKTLREVL